MKIWLKVSINPHLQLGFTLAVIAANRNPYYIRENSKRILRGALCSDSKFLADINVMDYSLVCGVLETLMSETIGAE